MPKLSMERLLNKNINETTLHDLLAAYFSLQNENLPYTDDNADIIFSQLNAVLRGGLTVEYNHPFKISVTNDMGAIQYSFNTEEDDNGSHDGGVDGVGHGGGVHSSGSYDGGGIDGVGHGSGVSDGRSHGSGSHDSGSHDSGGHDGVEMKERRISKIIYYCVWLYLLNEKGELNKIRDIACNDVDYPFKLRIVKEDGKNGETDNRRRVEPTDPRIIASSRHRRNSEFSLETNGNLLIDRYNLPFVSSVTMSCLDEKSFMEVIFSYLLGIANQENRWMRFEMIIDLLRTYDSALSRNAVIMNNNKTESESPDSFYEELVNDIYGDIIDEFRSSVSVHMRSFISERRRLSPFIGIPEKKDSILSSSRVSDNMFMILIEFSKIFRTYYREYDGNVLDFHWDKLFSHFGKVYPIKSVREYYESVDKARRKPVTNKNLMDIVKFAWKDITDDYALIDTDAYDDIKKFDFVLDVEMEYRRGLLLRTIA